MPKLYQPLKIVPTQPAASLPRATHVALAELTEASPAIRLMTDFRHTRPPMITIDTRIGEALQEMQRSRVGTLVALDGERLAGVITVHDIHGPKPVQFLHDSGWHRPDCRHSEVKVGDVMTPVERLPVVRLADLERSRIGDVWETLESWKNTHLMVMDGGIATELGVICGMIELERMEREIRLSAVDDSVIMTRLESRRGFRVPR
jgi:CBS domain